MIEFLYILEPLAKTLAVWIVPLAVVAYVVTYFVLALLSVIVWKNGRDPTIVSFVGKMGRHWGLRRGTNAD
jgi:hypothetical protein